MKQSKFAILLSVLSVLVFAVSISAQSSSFANPTVEYSFDIPDAKWKMTSKPSATSPNVEYVYVDRNEGHLDVRKLTVSGKSNLSDVIREEEQKLVLLPGYVAGKEENFGGFLKGTVFNYEYVKSGRPMIGRFYFLKAGDNTVYVLRFTGFRDKLRAIRNQTDSIARTFNLKKR